MCRDSPGNIPQSHQPSHPRSPSWGYAGISHGNVRCSVLHLIPAAAPEFEVTLESAAGLFHVLPSWGLPRPQPSLPSPLPYSPILSILLSCAWHIVGDQPVLKKVHFASHQLQTADSWSLSLLFLLPSWSLVSSLPWILSPLSRCLLPFPLPEMLQD